MISVVFVKAGEEKQKQGTDLLQYDILCVSSQRRPWLNLKLNAAKERLENWSGNSAFHID